MASAKAKIRHVFGDTFSCRAAPPDILVELSGCTPVTSNPPCFWGHFEVESPISRYISRAQWCMSDRRHTRR